MPFGLFLLLYLPSGAGPGAMSEAQRRAFGGNGFFFMFPPNGWALSCGTANLQHAPNETSLNTKLN
jgi:hypothetical protein